VGGDPPLSGGLVVVGLVVVGGGGEVGCGDVACGLLAGSGEGGVDPVAVGAGAVAGGGELAGSPTAAGGSTVGSDWVLVRPGGVVAAVLVGVVAGLTAAVSETKLGLALPSGLCR
jgi:hypothetical protein